MAAALPLLQILFPESYERTAAWLREQAVANADVLAVCKRRLAGAVCGHPRFSQLAAGLEVRRGCWCCRRGGAGGGGCRNGGAAGPCTPHPAATVLHGCPNSPLCQVHGRTKTLFSTLKKLLRLGNTAAGGRARTQVRQRPAAPPLLLCSARALGGWGTLPGIPAPLVSFA